MGTKLNYKMIWVQELMRKIYNQSHYTYNIILMGIWSHWDNIASKIEKLYNIIFVNGNAII